MKIIRMLLIGLSMNQWAIAAPVLNVNTAGADSITVYPDHIDKNLYYTSPSRVTLAKDDQGVPKFLYYEWRSWWGGENTMVSLNLTANWNQTEVNKVKANILLINPNAKFAALPFASSKLSFKDLGEFIETESCNHLGGVIESEQSCVIELGRAGRRAFAATVSTGQMFAVDITYWVNGVVQLGDGSFKTVDKGEGIYQVSGGIGGADLIKYPNLFLDEHGKPIDLSKRLIPFSDV
jgi:hypothetical protein